MTAVTKDFNPQQVQVGEAGLSSSLSGNPPYTIVGTAIAAGDTTRGLSGELKTWPEDTLREAADSLTGKNLVTDHENTVHSAVGEVVEARFQDGEVQFKAELDNKDIAEKVSNGRLAVSALIYHRDTEELDKNDEGAYIIDLAYFDNLSFVLKPGAAPSNNVEMGTTASMSTAELAESFGVAELASVSWDGKSTGKLDESSIDEDSFKSHYLFPGDTKSDSSFPLVDGSNNLRRGNVKSAWKLKGDAPEDISSYLKTLSNKFDNPPIDTDETEENSGTEDEVVNQSNGHTNNGVTVIPVDDASL